MLDICLTSHSARSPNLGVGALTVSEVEILRRLAREIGTELRITIATWREPYPAYVEGPDIRIFDLTGRSLVRPTGFFALARRSDIVIDIGAGDSFADIYSVARLNRMFAMQYLTRFAGTPLVMAPQTIGPFHRPRSLFLARRVLNSAAIVATRDAKSTAFAREMGIRREVIEASDVALRLPYDRPAPRPPGGPVRVGINVSGLLMRTARTGNNKFGIAMDYPALIRALITHFQGHPDGCEVHLVPHVVGPLEDDGSEFDTAPSAALAAEFPGVRLAPAFASPSEAKSYIAGLDFFMGARMHACIAAFSSGVPVVPMAYSRKFAGLFGSLGFDRTVDCTAETGEAVLHKIIAAYEVRDALAREMDEAFARGITKLGAYEAALKALMERRLARKRR
jgi:polysaccharide pyruvyl transferase WcaK-like protein